MISVTYNVKGQANTELIEISVIFNKRITCYLTLIIVLLFQNSKTYYQHLTNVLYYKISRQRPIFHIEYVHHNTQYNS